jgi:UDP-galactopyranose mutase
MTSLKYDYLIVGSGFAGSIAANKLAEHGFTVLIIEQRAHLGGNAYDHKDDSGALIHKYGPHMFHTNSYNIWNHISKFSEWNFYQHKVLSVLADGKKVPLPVNLNSLEIIFENEFEFVLHNLNLEFPKIKEITISKLLNSLNVHNKELGHKLFNLIYKGYSQKQWGIPANEVSKKTLSRVPIRLDHNDNHFADEFQFLPKHGYTQLFENILDHKNITIQLETTFQENMIKFAKNLIYTGSLDTLGNFTYGALPYRSLKFLNRIVNVKSFQDVTQENYSSTEKFTRIVEYTKMYNYNLKTSSIAYEFPEEYNSESNLPFYPIDNDQNTILYKKYFELAKVRFPGSLFFGRLADYKYYNMDQVIGRSLTLIDQLTR